jgi:NADPH2:quinone reductase
MAELPPPALPSGQIRVQIKAASLNFPDLLIVQNKYQMKPPLPFVPGTEFSGVVTEVGEGVKGFAVGQRVAAFGGLGGFATEVCIPAMLAMPLPEAFSFEDAAAFICTYATSHHALMDRAALKAGETVLILGAAGGVGTAAIQIAKAAGARVIAAAGSDAKCQACKTLGADARSTTQRRTCATS